MQDIISLYRHYPKYNHLKDYDIQHYIRPSILLNQYKKHYNKDKLVGFTNWAYLSDDAQHILQKKGIISNQDWNSGNNLWHIETICTSHLRDIMSWTKNNFTKAFGIGKIIKWLRTDNETIYRYATRTTKESWLWVHL